MAGADAGTAATATSGASHEELVRLLRELSIRELRVRDDRYLRSQSNNEAALRRKADAFLTTAPFVLPPRVLDWGCRHGADSAMLRHWFGDSVELDGCDRDPEPYAAFASYAGMRYSQLSHPFELPYEDARFDTVIASGVLEHVSHPAESLLELGRVLRWGGRLVITFLPNLFSYTEVAMTLARKLHHERRYTRRRIARELAVAGFEVIESGFHQVLPALTWVGGGSSRAATRARPWIERAYKLDSRLEGRFPFDRVSSNLYVVARAA
jgi:SAM-dependent methyltransferase